MLDCVVYLYPDTESAIDGRNVGGSGFLIGIPTTKVSDTLIVCVVTNKHVAMKANAVRLNTHDGAMNAIEVMHWADHPDGDDLSISPLGLNQTLFNYAYLGMEMLLTHDRIRRTNVGIGDDVFTVGRFTGHDGKLRNLPSARFGHIAQMPNEPIDNKGYPQESFLVDTRSINGFSGSPVFLFLSEQSPRASGVRLSPEDQGAFLLGIDWGHLQRLESITDNTGKPLADGSKVAVNSGMMAVVPAWKLRELIDSPWAKGVREDIVDDYLRNLEISPPALPQH
jgi:hypothetical protein